MCDHGPGTGRGDLAEGQGRVLGFEATTTLDEMLDEVIPWIAAAVANGTI